MEDNVLGLLLFGDVSRDYSALPTNTADGGFPIISEWSFGLGMPNEVNPLVERIPRPSATSETELAPWVPYTGGQKKLIDTRPCLIYTCMNQIITLSDIVQDMTRWLYAPQPFKAGTLMEFHSRLRHWFDQLPEQIRAVDENSIPAVLAVQ